MTMLVLVAVVLVSAAAVVVVLVSAAVVVLVSVSAAVVVLVSAAAAAVVLVSVAAVVVAAMVGPSPRDPASSDHILYSGGSGKRNNPH